MYHDLVCICLPSHPRISGKQKWGMNPLSVPSAQQGMGWVACLTVPVLLQPTLNSFPGTVVLNVVVP